MVMLAQLMLVLDAAVVNVALPHITADLNFTRAELSWVLNGYAVAFGGLLLLGGRVGDVFGRRRTFLVGVAAFTVFSLLGGLATSPLLLVIARALQCLGAAFAAPSVLALITTSARNDGERNRALALFRGTGHCGLNFRGVRCPRRLPDRRAGRILVGDHPLRPRAGSCRGADHQAPEGGIREPVPLCHQANGSDAGRVHRRRGDRRAASGATPNTRACTQWACRG